MPSRFVVSCEHGGNRIPPRYQPLFFRHRTLLRSHRGFDRGASWLARRLARLLKAPLHTASVSRLLVDLNRSLHNPRVFSEITGSLNPAERERILMRYYRPHRDRIEMRVRELTTRGICVVHLAIHTFTPCLKGRTRNADIGFLYDPRRALERQFCICWQRKIERASTALRVRRNYPYRGTADGLTTYLRGHLPSNLYAGVELEVNQRLITNTGAVPDDVWEALTSVF